MSINLTITADSAEELRSQVAGLSSIMQQESFIGAAGTTTATEGSTAPKRTRKPAETINSTDTSASDTEATNTDSSESTVVVTLEELRAKVAAVAQSGKQPQVKALLTEFGSDSVSKLPEDKRAAFIKALEAL